MRRREFNRNLLGLPLAAALPSMAWGLGDLDPHLLPPGGSITDVPGLKVGQFTHTERPTGCTVMLCEAGATAGVDVRGSAPGTRETDLLSPTNQVQQVNAILLSGGSAYGLDAASGVMRYLEEQKAGYKIGQLGVVPIVPAAILMDLGVGNFKIRPNAESGYKACLAASTGPVSEGCVGAGAGATIGKMFGGKFSMKSGLGTSSAKIGDTGIVVGAIVAVNAVGDVINPQNGKVVAGARNEDGKGYRDSMAAMMGGYRVVIQGGANTTIGVVATNAKFTKTQMTKIAQMAHDGYARAIIPVHTMGDGDTIFSMSDRYIECGCRRERHRRHCSDGNVTCHRACRNDGNQHSGPWPDRLSRLRGARLGFVTQDSEFAQGAQSVSVVRRSMRNLTAYGSRLWFASLVLPLALAAQSKVPQHPLDGLTTDEYWTVHDVLQKSGHMTESDANLKRNAARYRRRTRCSRGRRATRSRAEADVILEDEGKTIEARVDLSGEKLESWNVMPGVQAPIATGEFTALGDVIKHDPRVLAALEGSRDYRSLDGELRRRASISFRVFPEQDGQRTRLGRVHRFSRCLPWLGPHDRGHPHPRERDDEEGARRGRYRPRSRPHRRDRSFEERPMPRRARAIRPSSRCSRWVPGYKISKGEVSWQNWHFRFRLDQRVGAVVNMVRYQDGRQAAVDHVRRLALRDVRALHGSQQRAGTRGPFSTPESFCSVVSPSRSALTIVRKQQSTSRATLHPTTQGRLENRRQPACSSAFQTIRRGATSKTIRSTDAPAGSWCCAQPPSSVTTTT